jgi:hypothetical protein
LREPLLTALWHDSGGGETGKFEENEVMKRLIQWKSQPSVRAMILTSSRAVPGPSGCFSDYDVILPEDVRPFLTGLAEIFGRVLVLTRPAPGPGWVLEVAMS